LENVVEQKAVGICRTTFTRETLLNKIASTKNQSHRFNAATYACLLPCSGAFDWCRWTFNVEKYFGKPPPELRDFAHIPPTVCVLLCFINPILGNRYGPGVIP